MKEQLEVTRREYYVSPAVEVIEFQTEKGFAASGIDGLGYKDGESFNWD